VAERREREMAMNYFAVLWLLKCQVVGSGRKSD
jgi:hypothetical protein